MGPSIGTHEASSDESVHHVYGWEFYFHLPHNDGWYATHETSSSDLVHQGYVQNYGDIKCDFADDSLCLG